MTPKVPKQAEAERDSVINPQNYNCNQFSSIYLNFGKDMLYKRYKSTEINHRTWLHVPSRTHLSTGSDTSHVVEIQIDTSIKM